ncbi:large-conductance mechanosensitive channel protein MscL [Caulobacter mirabilis]|uniref:Large-conductance mechanosensitive channel n=1 Tax=Caulobacter mirabilis TaxID=69666 RepID=A0A2D2B3D6_9CAUL|nr:large-conductance mechanosensitive channel protein MscL [Caulobacter mirabilis]ATQ44770.1 large conductance mechanosensitive channel protein MscL [Caulobacter mirabilis]
MSVFKEFREFIARGNVIDLAVGIIIGGAFGAIVKSLVDQVIMPPVGLLLNGVDFAHLEIVLQQADAANKIEKVAIGYGGFINACIQFVIVAAAVFLLVKAVNTLRRQQAAEPEPEAPTPSEALLTEIRDLLKNQAKPAPAAAPAVPKAPSARKAPAKKA